MTYTVKTQTKTSTNVLVPRITAKCRGRQRTVDWNPVLGIQANHTAAAGEVLNLLLDDVQRAKVRHPSGAQRVTVATFNDGTGIVNVDV